MRIPEYRQIVLLLLVLFALTIPGNAEVPQMMSYQGLLTDETGEPVTDTADLTFLIYSDPGGSSLLWSENHANVAVEEGLFAVILGSVVNLPSNIFDGQTRYLGYQIDGGPISTDLTPIVSTAYAMRSVNSDTAAYAYAGPGSGVSGWVDDGSKVRLETANDNVGIGTSVPSEQLVVGFDIGGYGGKYIVSGAEFLADVCGYKMGFSNDHHATIACDGDGALFAVHTREYGTNYNNTIVARQGNVGIGVTDPAEPLVIGNNIGTYGGNRVVIGDVTPGVGTGLVIGEDSNNRSWILWDTDDNTLSIGTKEAGVNQGNAIIIGGGTVELFDNAISAREILDEPGIANHARGYSTNIYDSWVNVSSRECNFPTSGYVVVLATCEVAGPRNYFQVDLGITNNTNPVPPQVFTRFIDSDDEINLGYWCITIHQVFQVTAGSDTFQLLIKYLGPNSYATVWDAALTVMFFPTAYGTVSAVADGDNQQSAEPMLFVSKELPAVHKVVQPESEQVAALRAEFKAELQALREEIAALKNNQASLP